MALVGVPEPTSSAGIDTVKNAVDSSLLEAELQAMTEIADQNAQRIIDLECEREILLAQIDILKAKNEALQNTGQTKQETRRGRPPKAKK